MPHARRHVGRLRLGSGRAGSSLRHWSGLTMGRLYAGPTWLYRDGSKVIAKLVGTSPGGAGKLPKRACTSALIGRGERVPFSAEYAFFKKE
jgi:hypothetical protein